MSAPQIDASPETDLGSLAPPTFRPPGHIRETGAVEPYPRAERWATVTALPSAEEPSAEQAAETPSRMPWSQAAEPAVAEDGLDPSGFVEPGEQFGAGTAEPAVELDPQPSPPPKPTESAWEYATSVGYWMSVSVGASGQIFALADLMNIGWLSYPVAAAGAAFAEVTMIGASKRARNHRIAEHPKPWKLLLVIACLICGYATAMNAIHWLRYSVGMAVMFAGGSAVGFTVETTVEHIEAAEYERRKLRWQDEHRRWKDRQARRRAASPRPAASPSRTATSPVAAPAKTASGGAKKTSRASRSSGSEELKREIRAWARQHGKGAKAARTAFRDRPNLPALSTLKRWLGESAKH